MRWNIGYLLLSAALSAYAQAPPDLILHSGKIFTGDSALTWTEARPGACRDRMVSHGAHAGSGTRAAEHVQRKP